METGTPHLHFPHKPKCARPSLSSLERLSLCRKRPMAVADGVFEELIDDKLKPRSRECLDQHRRSDHAAEHPSIGAYQTSRR